MLYVALEAVKDHMRGEASRTVNDDVLLRALTAACRSIDDWCGRSFDRHETATARTYRASGGVVRTDDFWTLDGLLVAGAGLPASVDVEPFNGVVDGVAGFPYWRLVGRYTGKVTVTAKWGWAEVPAPVILATLHLTHTLVSHRDAPLGIAGMTEFGAARVPVDVHRQVAGLLAPYRRMDRKATVA